MFPKSPIKLDYYMTWFDEMEKPTVGTEYFLFDKTNRLGNFTKADNYIPKSEGYNDFNNSIYLENKEMFE